eukprot:868747-Ditylum_brightwellii.AAC.1
MEADSDTNTADFQGRAVLSGALLGVSISGQIIIEGQLQNFDPALTGGVTSGTSMGTMILYGKLPDHG